MLFLQKLATRDCNKLIVIIGSTLVAINAAIYITRHIENKQTITYEQAAFLDSTSSNLVDNNKATSDHVNGQQAISPIQKNNSNKAVTVTTKAGTTSKPLIQNIKNKTKIQITLADGDTLYSTLLSANIEKNAAHLIAVSVNKVYKLSQLRVGEIVTITVLSGEKVRSDTKAKVASMLIQTGEKQIKVDFNEKKRSYIANIVKDPIKLAIHNEPAPGEISKVGANNKNVSTNAVPNAPILGTKTISTKQNILVSAMPSEAISTMPAGGLPTSLNTKSSQQLAAASSIKPTMIQSDKYLAAGKISGSFVDSVKRTGVPSNVATEMAKVLGYAIDFQRDLSNKSLFKVIYSGTKVLYIHLHTGKKSMDIYRHELSDGSSNYFYKDGSGVRKSLIRTPVQGGTIGSGYGMRHHPVLGYSKMHQGLDYKAKRGTPVIAAGDGIIDTITQHRGWGRYVKIRHNGKYHTLYAHLDRFAKSIKVGSKVKQGDVIGFVGCSGMATGDHLHFELHENGHPINPKKAVNFNSNTLSHQQLAEFQSKQSKIDALLNKYQSVIVASIDGSGRSG